LAALSLLQAIWTMPILIGIELIVGS